MEPQKPDRATSADLVIGHSANEFHFAPRSLATWHESVVAIAVDDGRQVPEKVLAANCGVATVDVPSAVARAADRHSRDLLKVWHSRNPYPEPDADLDLDKGMCESCGHVEDWEALHSATPGVYCDDCAYLDGWDCDCEPCAEGREMSA